MSFEEIKLSENLEKLDEILIGGQRVVVVTNATNIYGQRVLTCGIVGKNVTKKRNKMTLAIPDKIPIITYH